MNVLRVINSTVSTYRKFQIIALRISTAKYVTHSGQREKYMESQNRWKEKDGVSKRWELIYKSPMETILSLMTTYVTISSSFIACGGMYYGFTCNKAELEKPILLAEDVILANSAMEGLIYVGAFICFHFALKVLLSRFVIRLYQDGDQYLAVFRGHFYNSVIKHEFHLKDFKKLKPIMVISWSDARFSLGKKHAILLENYFKTPRHFNYLIYKKKINDEDG